MDWLVAWILFSGSRQHRVLIETPEQREERIRRESESVARMLSAGGKFLGSGLGMVFMAGFFWTCFPVFLDIITGGNRCSDLDATSLHALLKVLLRC